MDVEVVYALPEQQSLLTVSVNDQCTAIEAVRQSGIVTQYPEIDLDNAKLGIFSDYCTHETLLKAGDRVEIYRPLLADPKEIRRRRVAEMAAKKKAAEKVVDS